MNYRGGGQGQGNDRVANSDHHFLGRWTMGPAGGYLSPPLPSGPRYPDPDPGPALKEATKCFASPPFGPLFGIILALFWVPKMGPKEARKGPPKGHPNGHPGTPKYCDSLVFWLNCASQNGTQTGSQASTKGSPKGSRKGPKGDPKRDPERVPEGIPKMTRK